MKRRHDTGPVKTALKIALAPSLPPTAEELARRKKVDEVVTRLRDEIGPIGVSVVTLIREQRDGDEAVAGG